MNQKILSWMCHSDILHCLLWCVILIHKSMNTSTDHSFFVQKWWTSNLWDFCTYIIDSLCFIIVHLHRLAVTSNGIYCYSIIFDVMQHAAKYILQLANFVREVRILLDSTKVCQTRPSCSLEIKIAKIQVCWRLSFSI